MAVKIEFEWGRDLYIRTRPGFLRNMLNRIGCSPHWHWMTWNPVLKYSERMVKRHGNINSHIIPEIKGKNIDASRMISIFGWGILWGTIIPKASDGSVLTGKGHPWIGGWRFGRIHIKYI
jgi:hypothetical protein